MRSPSVGVVVSRRSFVRRGLIARLLDAIPPTTCVKTENGTGMRRLLLREAARRGHPIEVVHTPARPKWAHPRQRRIHQLALETDRLFVFAEGAQDAAHDTIVAGQLAGKSVKVLSLVNQW